MVNDRLVHVLESRNLLSNVQCGFRKDHSTLDHLVRLETFTKKAFARKKQVLAVFFDLEKAYDTTWRSLSCFEVEKFSCKDCPAVFTKKRNLVRHIRQKHGDEKGPYLCDDSGASFLRHDNLVGHVREKHEGTTPQYLCEKCGLGFSRSTYLKRHRCDAVSVRKDARKRKSERKAEVGEKRKKRDRAALNNPLQPDIIQDNLEGEDVDNIISSIDEEGVRETYIGTTGLRCVPTIERVQITLIIPFDLKAVDTLEYARQQRPNTKWTVHSIALTTFYVDKLPDFPIGGCCSEDPMPSHVLENKAFVPFHIDTNHGKQFNDLLCFFRCLAAHYTEERRCVEARAQALFRQWTDTPIDEFEGVKLYELDELEDVFKVDIDVFEFKYDPPCLVPHRRSSYNHGDVLHLLCTAATFVTYRTSMRPPVHLDVKNVASNIRSGFVLHVTRRLAPGTRLSVIILEACITRTLLL
ncbi:Zinc finger protein 546-like [Plakobranchus ocellatus]|uniref:Zinc finger protein 546-like n=1 Tax=Plakobranchus ocellatus TaxID=259542 RepID=A0AAV4BK46_9GAST|nr:Zinc finger protein 546-like [Plakobranchus ocellatus]